jgi:hypothetical protein
MKRILQDPIYRYEARRFWTWRRYMWTAAFMFLWVGGSVVLVLVELEDVRRDSADTLEEFLALTVAAHLAWRAVLCLLALVGGVMTIAPEKASGHFEQFVLTPVEPRRYALMRYAGRLKGFVLIWLVLGLVLAGLFAYGFAACSEMSRDQVSYGYRVEVVPFDAGNVLAACLFLLLLHLDMLLMIMMDAAVGLRFSSTSRRPAWALVQALLVSFLAVPLVTGFGAALGAANGVIYETSTMVPLASVLVHMVLGVLIMYLCLKQAERAIEKAFYRPEDT